jgi:hypothetical protein
MPAWSRDRFTWDAEAIVEMDDVNLRIYGNGRRVVMEVLATADTVEAKSRNENIIFAAIKRRN